MNQRDTASAPLSKNALQELENSNSSACLPVDCLIAFGSNLGDPEQVFAETILRLSAIDGVQSLRHGQPVKTVPVGGPADQPEYLNAAIRWQTTLPIEEIHQALIKCETAMGRVRRTRWGARRIDLDLLLYGETVFESERLIVPHPRMSFRRFVLEPALEVAGGMRHPIANMSIAELIEHLDSKPSVILWVCQMNAVTKQAYQQIVQQQVSQNWEIILIDRVAEFERRRANAKLVAWGAQRPTEFSSCRFRGPQLSLPADPSKILPELVAAIEAMGAS